jgi:Niemann-Pick C1 protein
LASCPACYNNFVKFWCLYTCSPDQSMFVDINQSWQDEQQNSYVSVSTYNMQQSFAGNLFDSCKDVKFGLTGNTVMKTVFGASNYSEFLNFIGTSSKQYSNITIDMSYNRDNVSANATLRLCSDSCSCNDCQASCPLPPPIPQQQVHTITVTYLTLFTFLGFTAFTVAVLIIAYFVSSSRVKLVRANSEDVLVPSLEDRGLVSSVTHRATINGSSTTDEREEEPSKFNILAQLNRAFAAHGRFIGRRPVLVLLLSVAFTAVCSVWIYRLEIITQPDKLWVPSDSVAAQDKAYFDSKFGPFYRIEMVIITPKGFDYTQDTSNDTNFHVITRDHLLAVMKMQDEIAKLTVEYDKKNYTLIDLCFKPVLGKGCAVESLLGYWQNDITVLQNFTDSDIQAHIQFCELNPVDTSCRDDIGSPVQLPVVLGGYNSTDYTAATTLFVTYLLNNYQDPALAAPAMAWEMMLMEYLRVQPLDTAGLNLVYSTERSITDELSRETTTDIPTVIISYSAMFLYVSLALGEFRCPIAVHSKFLLGLGGIVMVIMSISISVGLCSLFGLPATLVISEVIPFLVLAIGVDNIFILVETFQSLNPRLSVEERLSHTLRRVGTSIALAAVSETFAFLLGVLTRMPAVVAFSVYAALAIFFDFVLQLTAFAALMALDARRLRANRLDCVPCVKWQGDTDDTSALLDDDEDTSRLLNNEALPKHAPHHSDEAPGVIAWLMRRVWAPVVLNRVVKTLIIIFFVGLAILSINFATQVQLGLPQQEALPQDSYLIPYFDQQAVLGRAGPPVYFVIKEYDYSQRVNQNNLCALGKGQGGCKDDSLLNQFTSLALLPQYFYFTGSLAPWLDNYLSWLSHNGCCQKTAQGTQCLDDRPPWVMCDNCMQPSDFDQYGRPAPETFYKYLPFFMMSNCSDSCALCGSPYQADVIMPMPYNYTEVHSLPATRYRGFHTALRTQDDFIGALKYAYYLADNLKESLGLPIFPYSVFYIFFEQYLYIVNVAFLCLGLACLAVFLVTLALLGNVTMSLLVVFTVAMIEIDVIGIMYLWGINLNAVSTVNLVMAIGISVEFCVHIAHSFMLNHGTRAERARAALTKMGASVFKGITLTKFVGVVVLAFASSEIFRVYYFRMFFSIVILGALHGLMFFPALLSIVGPRPHTKSCALY